MKSFLLFRIILLSLFLSTTISAQTCPECDSNRGHLAGHGTSDGRTIANIYIETPQGTTDYSILNGAVGGASGSWNTATDGSGNHIHYEFRQTTDQSQADFTVTIGNGGGCAQIDTTVYPHVITVAPPLCSRVQQTLKLSSSMSLVIDSVLLKLPTRLPVVPVLRS